MIALRVVVACALLSGRIQFMAAQSTAAPTSTTMKNDLKNLVTSQEVHFADWATYAPAIGPRPAKGVAYFIIPAGTSIVLSNVSESGWTGVMTGTTSGSKVTCGVFVGERGNSPNPAVKVEATPACWGDIAVSTENDPPGSSEAIIATMRDDLRILATSQEAHFADYGTYATRFGTKSAPGSAYFTPQGNNRLEISNASQEGWTGVITNPAVDVRCGVYVGPRRNAPNATIPQEGAPACWNR